MCRALHLLTNQPLTMAMTTEERTARREQRKAEKEAAKKAASIQAERDQKPVRRIEFSIEWKKSRMWGHNPNLSARIQFTDGTWDRAEGITASGCGYDKESTVIAELWNMFLKYKLWQIHDRIVAGEDVGELPYGFYARPAEDGRDAWVNYNGGVGTSCYYRIAEFIGGKMEQVASGNSFDAWVLTMND